MARYVSHRAACESLEHRRLLTATLEDGTLLVMGRPFSDDILIREEISTQTGEKVVVVEIDAPGLDIPATHQEFPAKDVNIVLVRAGGGNDKLDMAIATYSVVAIAGTSPLTKGSRVDAGSGNDSVYGGMARDAVLSGIGNDLVLGFAGNDWIDGGRGNDDLHGGNGNDTVFGGLDDDRIGGEFGDDVLFGGYGNDTIGSVGAGPLPNEPGDDVVAGGGGDDWVLGGEGNDHITGGPGRDTFVSQDSPSEWLDKQPDEPVVAPPPILGPSRRPRIRPAAAQLAPAGV